MLNRQETKQLVEEYKLRFGPYIGKSLVISFGPHEFTAVLEEVRQARLQDVRNLPDKRTDSSGQSYTPSMLMLKFNEGVFFFVLEDIKGVVLTTQGVRVIMVTDEVISLRIAE